MHYEGTVIRPPSEAGSIILQVSVGCSHNQCSFCGAYRGVRFRLKEDVIIQADLDFAATYCQRQTTIFLADGNVLALGEEWLLRLLARIRKQMPWVRRISCYGNCADILRISPEGFAALKKAGLGRVYMGLESGHDTVLAAVCKGNKSLEMISAANRVRNKGLFLSVTALLGLGGTEFSEEHAMATGQVLQAMQPNQVAILTLMLLANTPLFHRAQAGLFQLPPRDQLFRELRLILENLNDIRCQFQANHASNYFALDGRLPKDKILFFDIIQKAMNQELPLKAEARRAL